MFFIDTNIDTNIDYVEYNFLIDFSDFLFHRYSIQ